MLAGFVAYTPPSRGCWPTNMKLIYSFLITLGLMVAAFVGLHYLILFLKLNDVTALILLALPMVVMIAWSTHETARKMLHSAIVIYACFVSVILAAAGLVWFIG